LENISLSIALPNVKQEPQIKIDPVIDSHAKPWDLLIEYKKLKAFDQLQTINLF
jgi:hypothetical protein